MSEPAEISPADALRVLANRLGIPDAAIADDLIASFERDAHVGIGLIRAARFFADPNAAGLVDALLAIEDSALRRAIITACRNIAASFGPGQGACP